MEDALTAGKHEAKDPADAERDPDSPGFPDRRFIDVARDPHPGRPGHALPDGADRDPLIDMSRDPTSGVPDHALPDPEDSDG
jgi:hypothetical protein